MSGSISCDFCNKDALAWRVIRTSELFTSFVSSPWFRTGHCLVVPNRHITTVAELEDKESSAIMRELGRLSKKLDVGFGTGIMQKYHPLQAENGIKISHLHFHVFPRKEHELGLFPVPEPNTFDGFTAPAKEDVIKLAHRLKD